MPQTLAHSNLGALRAGSPVNLERAMAADGRFGGHIVSGHIDGTGTIRRIRRDQNAVRFAIEAPASIMALIVQRGSVAIDGISLTVAELAADAFEVSIIPHTIEQTTLSHRKPGDAVNLENDVVGKYVQRLLHGACTTPTEREAANASASPSPLSLSYLSAHGF
ncbi:MAG: riboflavin synthase [Senegalimassilia faecalis]